MYKSQSLRSKRPMAETAAAESASDPAAPPANYHVANEPLSAGYEERSLTEIPTLPLQSTFLDWSIEYFREPQMKATEAEEPGSEEYNERLWRRSRNEGVLRETQPQKAHAGTHKWNSAIGFINNGSQPTKMTFHQFENHVAVADDGNTIRVWDWATSDARSRFSNGNPEGSKIVGRQVHQRGRPGAVDDGLDGRRDPHLPQLRRRPHGRAGVGVARADPHGAIQL